MSKISSVPSPYEPLPPTCLVLPYLEAVFRPSPTQLQKSGRFITARLYLRYVLYSPSGPARGRAYRQQQQL